MTSTDATESTGTCPIKYPFAIPGLFQVSSEFARLRDEEPITRITLPSGDTALLVTRYEDCRAVLADQRFSRMLSRPDAARLRAGQEQFSNEVDSPFGNFASSTADPPGHTRWRRLVAKAFTARRVEALRPRITEVTDALLDALEAAPRPVDFMSTVAFTLPIIVICELLGVPVEDRELFDSWAKVMVSNEGNSWRQAAIAMKSLQDYAKLIIERKRTEPGNDLVSGLVAAHDEDEGQLDTDELVSTLIMLLIAGYESAAVQVGKNLLALFANPAQFDLLRADPGLIPSAVDELLRYGALGVGTRSARYATEDITVGGTVIPRGSTVLVPTESANRDADQFPEPDRLDVTRTNAAQHLSFGAGPTFCIGAALARVELQVLLERLLTRFPEIRLAVDIADVPLRGEFVSPAPSALPVTW